MSLTIYIRNEDSSFEGELDGLQPEQGLGLTKALYSATDITKRSTEHSLGVPLLATKNNNDVLSHFYDPAILIQSAGQFTPEFNAREKAFTVLMNGSEVLLDGFMRLDNVDIDEENRVVYNVTFYAKEIDIFTAVGESYLTDLNLSEFDHEYTTNNIQASWSATIIQNGAPVAFELGVGYVYPMIEYGQAGALAKPENWYYSDFRPAIWAKQYLDKIFEATGFEYQSDFFNSERFKRLILPFTNGDFRLSADEITERSFSANRITSDYASELQITAFNSGDYSQTDPIVFNNELADPLSQYNPATGVFVCDKPGKYNLTFNIDGAIKRTGSNITVSSSCAIFTALGIIKKSGGVYSLLSTIFCAPASTSSNITTGDSFNIPITLLGASVPSGGNTGPVTLLAGDEVYIAGLYVEIVNSGAPAAQASSDWQVITKASVDSYFYNTPIAVFDYGDLISMDSCIPINYKQKDFLFDIFRVFNLCMEAHPTLTNTLIIEPKDEGFYTDEIINLENLLDQGTKHTITPQPFSDNKSYKFTYSEDGDYYNKLYQETYNEVYGQLTVNIDNDFKGNNNELKVSFAPTPLIGQPQAAPTTGRVISSIEFRTDNGDLKPTAGKPRLLYYNMKTAGPTWNLWDNANNNAGPYESYPYAGHLDDQFEPTFDLNFGLPQVLYYQSVGVNLVAGPSIITFSNNQTVYDIYWRNTIREIEDSNARGFDGWFEIPFSLYRQLSLRNLHYFEGLYWRLLQIVDFECAKPQKTQMIFVKALDLPAIETINTPINGGTGEGGGGDFRLPGIHRPTRPFNNSYPDNAGTIGGTNNRVQGNGGNTVTILNGSNNYVPAGFERITLINTSSYEVTESNITVISGQTYHEGPVTFNSDVNIGGDTLADYINNTVAGVNGAVSVSTDYTVAAGIKTVFAAGGAGGIEITLPAPAEERTLQIIKTDNTPGAVDLIGHDVNGAALSLTSQYDKCIIISDGTAYYRLS